MPEKFSEKVEIVNSHNSTMINLDAESHNISLGFQLLQTGPVIDRQHPPEIVLPFWFDFQEGSLNMTHVSRGEPPFGVSRKEEILNFDGKTARLDLNIHDGKGAISLDASTRKVTVGDAIAPGTLEILGAHGTIIRLDGATGDVVLTGADCAEEFDIAGSEESEPGTVLVINDDTTLSPCIRPYDKRVAGVVAGGNSISPGIILNRRHYDASTNKRSPVTLTGKVYCKADSQYAPIEIGDLLTTSETKGHAMKADDPSRAFGAVIGKALHPLEDGVGLIPILAALR